MNVGFVNGWFYRCGLEPVQVGERGRKGVFIGIIFTFENTIKPNNLFHSDSLREFIQITW